MNELIYFLIVNATVLAHAIPDFIVWFFLAKEQVGWKHAKTFRISKFVYDFPVTFAVLFWVIGLPLDIIGWFYMIKWAHGADSWYNVFSKWCGEQASKNGFWRAWTPLGIVRSKLKYRERLGGWIGTLTYIKGNVMRNEGYAQTLIAWGLFIIYLIIRYSVGN